MTTGCVIGGKGLFTAIVNGPLPGMLKSIILRPATALALRIACRSEPGPLSFVLVTVKASATLLENSDVFLLLRLVAVAVMNRPTRGGAVRSAEKLALPKGSVITFDWPSNCWPWTKSVGSAALLAKNW